MISLNGCNNCLGEGEYSVPAISPVPIPQYLPDLYAQMGDVWNKLDQQCRQYLPESYCRQILGYRPMFGAETNNPYGLKWYWFVVMGYLASKMLKTVL